MLKKRIVQEEQKTKKNLKFTSGRKGVSPDFELFQCAKSRDFSTIGAPPAKDQITLKKRQYLEIVWRVKIFE